jgi:hypothetical protein
LSICPRAYVEVVVWLHYNLISPLGRVAKLRIYVHGFCLRRYIPSPRKSVVSLVSISNLGLLKQQIQPKQLESLLGDLLASCSFNIIFIKLGIQNPRFRGKGNSRSVHITSLSICKFKGIRHRSLEWPSACSNILVGTLLGKCF